MINSGFLLRVWTILKVLRENLIVLFYAWRNPATPKYVRTMLVIVMAYLVSPIDIIPDYLPIVGLLDDMTIVPAALLFLTNVLPTSVRRECEQDMAKLNQRLPYIFTALAILSIAWVGFLIWLVYKLI